MLSAATRTTKIEYTPAALPRTGIVLVGTPQTVRSLHAQLMSLAPAPVVAGCVLVNGGDDRRAENGEMPAPVLGTLDDLPLLAARFGLITAVVSLPAVMRDAIVRAGRAVRLAGLPEKFVPTIQDLLGGALPTDVATESEADAPATPAPARSGGWSAGSPTVDLALLIGREPYSVDAEAVGRILAGKRVLITGAGGSIGAELARVAAGFGPSQLILMERAENALFEIDRQISRRFPGVARKAVLHDVVDTEATLRILGDLRPHAVFHAAAHKHVPLMEDHPAHAVTNNLFGTKSIADAAAECGAERFVMISSDKAVNPTSVMGATKRLAEMYVRGLAGKISHATGLTAQSGRPTSATAPATRLSMVRFGNVLGSACSVLTIWSAQLSEGGPITITDPRMTRFFMTIPEAATLVIESATLDAVESQEGIKASRHQGIKGKASPVGVYVLDMGEPIRILDLAARFVRAHGLWPRLRTDVADAAYPPPPPGVPSIDVVFSGIRPGEKIHEELAYAAEMLKPTAHPGIRAWAGPGFGADQEEQVSRMVAELSAARFSGDRESVLAAIRKHVPEMRRAG